MINQFTETPEQIEDRRARWTLGGYGWFPTTPDEHEQVRLLISITADAQDAYFEFREPPAPLDEQVAAEIHNDNVKWMDVANQPKDWEGLPDVRTISELEAEHADWLDEQATRESERP